MPSDRWSAEARPRSAARPPRSRAVRTMWRREVAVAEPEPGLLAVVAELRPSSRSVSPSMPQPHSTCSMPGERVHDGVVVGHHEQPVALRVVAGVDDDRQVARRGAPARPSASFAPPTPPASATTRRHASRVEAARRTSPIRSIVSRSYGAGMPTMTCRKPRSMIRPEAVGDRSAGSPTWTSPALVVRPGRSTRCSPGTASSAAARVSRMTSREADRHLDRRRVAADVRAVLAQDRRPSPRAPRSIAADVFHCVAVAGDRPQRLLRPGPADQDRQAALDGPRLAQRVVHPVDAALVASTRSPSSSRRMSITDSSSRSSRSPKPDSEVDAEGLVLALEPGAADAEDRPAARRGGRASSRASP